VGPVVELRNAEAKLGAESASSESMLREKDQSNGARFDFAVPS
jgi:hypothetical protein